VTGVQTCALPIFPAALLGRLVVIPYYPLGDEVLGDIIRLQLNRIKQRVEDSHQVPFSFEDGVVDLIRQRCTELESGARMVDAILTNSVLPSISGEVLQRMLEGRELRRIHLGLGEEGFSYGFD
jgi:type VI secretion system protein VasG